MNAAQYNERQRTRGAWDYADIALLVRYYQEHEGLSPEDGMLGPATVRHLLGRYDSVYDAAPPVPRGRSGVYRMFGKPSFVPGKGRFIDIDDKWERAHIRRYKLHTGKSIRLHKLIGPHFVRTYKEACIETGYTPHVVGYVARRISSKNQDLSLHCLCAFDADSRNNPWGGIRKDGTISLLRQNPDWVLIFERAGFSWGGRWTHKDGDPDTPDNGWGDDMHFEYRQPLDASEHGAPVPTERK